MGQVTRRRVLAALAATAAASGGAGAGTVGGTGTTDVGGRAGRAVAELGLVWQRRYGGGGYDRLEAAAAADEGAVLAGQSDDPPGGQWVAWLHRTGPAGDTRWHRTFADDWLETALAVAAVDDGFVVAGRRKTGPRAAFDAWVRRTDTEGRVQWRWAGDAEGRDEVAGIVDEDPVRVAGVSGSSDATPWVRTFDADGGVETSRAYGDGPARRVHDAAPTGDGSVLLAGTRQTADRQYADAWLARVGAEGDLAWSRAYGGDRAERASAVHATDDGAVFAGLTGSEGGGLWDVWLVRVDAAGRRQWARTHGGGGADYATDLLAADGGYVVVGASDSGDRYRFDALTLGVTREGAYRWHRFDGGTGRDVARAVLPRTGDDDASRGPGALLPRTGDDDASRGPGALVAGQYSSAPDRIDAWLLGLSPDAGTPTPVSTRSPTETPPETPAPTPTDSPTPTYGGVDMADVRDDETTAADGPGFGVVGALAVLGLGGWLSGQATRASNGKSAADEEE